MDELVPALPGAPPVTAVTSLSTPPAPPAPPLAALQIVAALDSPPLDTLPAGDPEAEAEAEEAIFSEEEEVVDERSGGD